MLVLTRHVGQSIVIGHDITVTVLDVRGDQVRLGINAPDTVDVHREEVYLELQRERAADAAPAEPLGNLGSEVTESNPPF